MHKILLLAIPALFLLACSDPEAEKVIVQKQNQAAGIESQIQKTKAQLESLKANDAALRQELDSLDMSR